jgi:hypothetical protein
MKDGDIDYSGYSSSELKEALVGINRAKYPKNYNNLIKVCSGISDQELSLIFAEKFGDSKSTNQSISEKNRGVATSIRNL